MEAVVGIRNLKPELSAFGLHVYKLMLSRNINSFVQLCEAFDKVGDRLHRQTLADYMKGKSHPPCNFGRRLAKALDLSPTDERELAWMLYKWG